jgi:predicted metal-dependent hydrolase
MSEQLHIDKLVFVLRRSSRRKTIGITVDRDGSLVVRAPIEPSLKRIEQIAREKLLWTYAKLAEKKLLFRPTRPKRFIEGEGFYYLGESFRLLLVEPGLSSQKNALRLKDNWFMLRRDAHADAEEHFIRWYSAQASRWLSKRVERFASRVDVNPQGLEVRRLGFRWGSCTRTGRLNFHWRTIQLPPEIIDYIVVHELVHLHKTRHDAEFWRRVERVVPDYSKRKEWLSLNGGKL